MDCKLSSNFSKKTMKPPYPKPHRNQLLEGLRPTLELNTFHCWPGISCSPLPQGLHQTLLPLQLKLKDLAVRQRRCPGQRASQGSNSATELNEPSNLTCKSYHTNEVKLTPLVGLWQQHLSTGATACVLGDVLRQ